MGFAHKAAIASYHVHKALRNARTSWSHWRSGRLYRHWLRDTSEQHDVLMGSILGFRGGVRNHMLAIQRYSTHRVGLVPSDDLLKQLIKEQKQQLFTETIQNVGFNACRIVHTHAHPWMIRACAESASRHFKWIHTYHTLYFPDHWEGRLADWQQDTNDALVKLAPAADIRISVAKWLRDYLSSEYGIESVYIPNGVDVAVCDEAVGDRFTQATGLSNFVLFASSIRSVKNPAAFLRLANAMPEQQFVMIGDGLSAANIRDKLRLDVPQNMVLFEQMEHTKLLDAIAACRCFVVTSHNEGLPTVLMEAMALRRACVVPDLDGSQEAVGDESHGFIYRHDSDESLVQQTTRALHAPSSFGDRARERVLREYDWSVVIPQIDDLYCKFL